MSVKSQNIIVDGPRIHVANLLVEGQSTIQRRVEFVQRPVGANSDPVHDFFDRSLGRLGGEQVQDAQLVLLPKQPPSIAVRAIFAQGQRVKRRFLELLRGVIFAHDLRRGLNFLKPAFLSQWKTPLVRTEQ